MKYILTAMLTFFLAGLQAQHLPQSTIPQIRAPQIHMPQVQPYIPKPLDVRPFQYSSINAQNNLRVLLAKKYIETWKPDYIIQVSSDLRLCLKWDDYTERFEITDDIGTPYGFLEYNDYLGKWEHSRF